MTHEPAPQPPLDAPSPAAPDGTGGDPLVSGSSLPGWLEGLHSALDEALGFRLTELDAQRTAGRMPVAGHTQPAGLWHGGASGVMVETLASMASWAHARELGLIPVGVDLNVTHHRPVREGWVNGVATPVHLGRTSTCYEVVLTDDAGRRVATGRLTCRLLEAAELRGGA